LKEKTQEFSHENLWDVLIE